MKVARVSTFLVIAAAIVGMIGCVQPTPSITSISPVPLAVQ
jgi:hypothetical protein